VAVAAARGARRVHVVVACGACRGRVNCPVEDADDRAVVATSRVTIMFAKLPSSNGPYAVAEKPIVGAVGTKQLDARPIQFVH